MLYYILVHFISFSIPWYKKSAVSWQCKTKSLHILRNAIWITLSTFLEGTKLLKFGSQLKN